MTSRWDIPEGRGITRQEWTREREPDPAAVFQASATLIKQAQALREYATELRKRVARVHAEGAAVRASLGKRGDHTSAAFPPPRS